MIVNETVVINGVEYSKTYSDSGRYIERDGDLYVEAIDPIGYDRVYTETEIEIPIEEETIQTDEQHS